MKQFLIFYQWYEFTSQGIIKANTEEEALLKFARTVWKLNDNYELERKYGYGGSISPFFFDEEDEKEGTSTFEATFKEFLENSNSGNFEIIELTPDTEGIITTKGFYNGEEN